MRKLVLIPESKYLQLTEEVQSRNNASSILQAVRHPERQEMIKKYNLLQSILNDSTKPDEIKMSEYGDAFNDFSILRDRVKEDVTSQRTDAKPADAVASVPIVKGSRSTKKKSVQTRPPGIPRTPKRKDVVSTGDDDDDENDENEFVLTPQQLAMLKRKREAEMKKSTRLKSARKTRAIASIPWENR